MTEGPRNRSQATAARRASKRDHIERQADTRPLLGIAETAEYLDVSRWTVQRLIRDGELRSVIVGARRKVRPLDIDAYLDRAAS